ncbi:MAG: carboxypeptidase, partial [Lactobacillus crispatus]|nr:carboxypeptidase [Lactobacillus crispatus]
YMQGISETGITRLYKAEMEGILPYTAQTEFTEKAPNQIVKNNGSNDDWTNGLGEKIQDGLGSAGQKINEWYNSLKGLFGQ